MTAFNILSSIRANTSLNENLLVNEHNESLNLTDNILEDFLSSKNTKLNFEQFDNLNCEFDDNEIYLCVLFQSNKLACAYYDLNKKCLYYMLEIQESLKFELTNILIDDLEPYCVITSPRCDPKFVNFLKQKCKFATDDKEKNQIIIPEDNFLINDEKSADFILKLREKPINFVTMVNNEFNFDSCKQRIFNLSTLESMPNDMNESNKILYFSSLIDFDSKLTIKSCGGLLKYLSNNRVNFELEKDVFETPIFHIKKLDLKNLLIMDPNSYKSLQIFNYVDYLFAYKQTSMDMLEFRSHLNDKFNKTLYSLFLSRIHTKFGIGKLRSFMMKPTRDLEILNQRHKIVDFLIDVRNQDLVQHVIKHLKKCKYINPILKRMRITRCGLNEWKRLYKTTQSFLELCKIKRILDKYLNIDSNIDTEYEIKFDFLINLFERTINLNESNEKNEVKIQLNISNELDEKKLMYSQLPEFLTEMAEKQMITHNLNGCKMTYLQLLGFLLILTIDNINLDFNCGEPNEQLMYFEQMNGFKFIFKSNEKMYYKSPLCFELDSKIGDLATEINDIESQILDSLQLNFIKYSHFYANMIDFCGELDCLLSFALIAKEYDYYKPKIEKEKGSFINAKKVRHPLVELGLNSLSSFVPNDVETGLDKTKIKILTSPNASGKTVYLKQIALLVYMTYIGSFVPGVNVHIGDFDRIFTRLKSNECIAIQMSSYSIDLKQIVDSVNESSSKSLILIDEFGNGTNFFDGQAIVAAILRYWSSVDERKCPHVLLSTHFYELMHNASLLFGQNKDKIEFLNFDFMLDDNEFSNEQKIVFLYKLKNGLANSSHAIDIIKKSNLPKECILNAEKLYKKLMEIVNNSTSDNKCPKPNFDELKKLISSDKAITNFEEAKDLVKNVFETFYNFQNEDESMGNLEEKIQMRGSKVRDILIKLKNSL